MKPYLLTLAQLHAAAHPPAWWLQRKLRPLVNTWTVGDTGFNPYHPDAPAKIPAVIEEVSRLCPLGYLIEFPCYTPEFPGVLNPFPALLASTQALGTALRAAHGGGLVLDGEDYRASHGGGAMQSGAWQNGTAAKGKQLAQALGAGLSLGCMVWAGEVSRQPGLTAFCRGAFSVLGKRRSLVLGEDYAAAGAPGKAETLGARYLAGWMPEKRGARVPVKAGWVYDPARYLLE